MSIRKHTAYNMVGLVLPLGLSLITIPIYMRLIGEARYGVLAIAWLLLGYFGLFDLGLGRATAHRIAALAEEDVRERAETFWTAIAINCVFGAIGGLVIWGVDSLFFGKALSVDASLRKEVSSATTWLVLAVPLATLSGVLTGALQGRAAFRELNVISVAGAVVVQLFPLAIAHFVSPSLELLMPATVIARALTLVLLFWRCRTRVYQGLRPAISRRHAKELLMFGGWVTVTSLVSPLMVVLDRFVIGASIGARAITYYTVPFQFAERTLVPSGALSSALFPRLAAMERADANKLAITSIRTMAVAIAPLMVIALLAVDPFLRIWLSPEFSERASFTGQILLLGFWINGFAAIPYTQLQASGRPDIVAKCHLGELVPYLACLYLGLKFWGLPGAAAAFGLRTLADWSMLGFFARTLRESARLLLLPTLILFSVLGMTRLFATATPAWWITSIVVLLATFAWSWSNAPTEAKALLSQKVRLSI